MPVVVHVLPGEIGIEITDAIERGAGRTAFDEYPLPDRLPDDCQSPPVCLQRIRTLVMKAGQVHLGMVFRQ
jgi:hypothetical protein